MPGFVQVMRPFWMLFSFVFLAMPFSARKRREELEGKAWPMPWLKRWYTTRWVPASALCAGVITWKYVLPAAYWVSERYPYGSQMQFHPLEFVLVGWVVVIFTMGLPLIGFCMASGFIVGLQEYDFRRAERRNHPTHK